VARNFSLSRLRGRAGEGAYPVRCAMSCGLGSGKPEHRMVLDTIFAPATGAGRAGVAVVRVSGPASRAVLALICGLPDPMARRAIRCRMVDPFSGVALDDGLAIWFPGPASFTGEDVAEFHVHGGRATIEAVCAALGRLVVPGNRLRLAEAGEFSRRAFDNGKLDLTAIEGLSDLVAAETEAQRRQALRQLDGALGVQIEKWRTQLLSALARVEAAIDFPDEDLPDHLVSETDHNILGLLAEISQIIDDDRRGERVRDGLSIAIIGAPNVGKSSLLNALARRDAAIVSDAAGTTRDVVEVRLDLGGYPVMLADTAGLRETSDFVEQEGVRRALCRAEAADLTLVVFDGTAAAVDEASLAQLGRNCLAVINKIDLGDVGFSIAGAIPISAQAIENIDVLVAEIERRVVALMDVAGPAPLTRARHRAALVDCAAALDRAVAEPGVDLKAEDLRLAVVSLGRITGRVDIEDVLDVIFSEFCIGK
jgi:tRNA modification GTPase